MNRQYLPLHMVCLITFWLVIGCTTTDHSGHDHGSAAGSPVSDESHDDVYLSKEAMEWVGIEVARLGTAVISTRIELPGEIGFNEDQLAHITPRYAGIAIEVSGMTGSYVEQGRDLAVIESNESLSPYSISSPISGYIISKHITPGEFVGDDEDIFIIADLSSVWVNCVLYQKDLPNVSVGQRISITEVGTGKIVDGRISYVAPIFKETTRSAIVRTVLPTPNREWRPGMFVKGTIDVSSNDPVPAVPNEAVQMVEEQSVVFIPVMEGQFEPVPVQIGARDAVHSQILSGLEPGDAYVASGAFHLKAELVTGSLGDHAGHGH